MTEKEWLDIGYEKNIIESRACEKIAFRDVYREWFIMKMRCAKKKQSVDRIEVTYNKYYSRDPIVDKYVSEITDGDILEYLRKVILNSPGMTIKELGKIMQIIKAPLVYFRDIGKGGVPLYDWEMIKRNLPIDKIKSKAEKDHAVPMKTVEHMLDCVINQRIYPEKYCTSLLLCMNFFLGLRVGELASLTFNDFDMDKNVVRIFKTECKFYERSSDGSKIGHMVYCVSDNPKTVNAIREIPLLPEVKLILQKIKERHVQCGYDTPYLCYDGQDCIKVRSLDRTLRRLCELCEVQYFNSHLIRKTFATVLHDNGVPTRAISDLLGHSEIATTESSYILSYTDKYDQYFRYMHSALKFTS